MLLSTSGTSQPVKSGFITAVLDQETVSGVAIFKFSSGSESSVLPVDLGARFSLFVERSATLHTEIAIFRTEDTSPIQLMLQDVAGTEIRTASLLPSGAKQFAGFLGELFADLPPDFTGTLLMTSDRNFVPVGLRLGRKPHRISPS